MSNGLLDSYVEQLVVTVALNADNARDAVRGATKQELVDFLVRYKRFKNLDLDGKEERLGLAVKTRVEALILKIQEEIDSRKRAARGD